MQSVRKVVVLGGGTSGWIAAALLKKVLGPVVDIDLIESDDIGTVGVGEATIPPIRLLNNVLGINEAEFLRETKATIKLAIKFENWRVPGEGYYHTFGAPGKSLAFCHFHHLWRRAQQLGDTTSLWQYDLNYLCAEAGKFAPINSKDPVLELPYAYHFDAGLYARFLRKFSEQMGVVRHEGKVSSVTQHGNGVFRCSTAMAMAWCTAVHIIASSRRRIYCCLIWTLHRWQIRSLFSSKPAAGVNSGTAMWCRWGYPVAF